MSRQQSKIYDWSNETTSKDQYHEFFAHLRQTLGVEGCAYVLDATSVARNKPISPGPQSETFTPSALREWQKLAQTFYSDQKRFYGDFDKAIGILQSMFAYGSKVRHDIDDALDTIPPPIPPATVYPPDQWTPDLKFFAALLKLKSSYAPSSVTDTTAIRRKMQELSDKTIGFHDYSQTFTRLLVELKSAGAAVEERELREWVKKGITNPQVITYLASTVLQMGMTPNHCLIFDTVRHYLQQLGDENDPYRVVRNSQNVLTALLATSDGKRKRPFEKTFKCTRCWRDNHGWRNCKEVSCGVCKHQLLPESKFCPNYANHKEPGTNWAPPHLLSKLPTLPSLTLPHITPPANQDAVEAAKTAFRNSRKALRATVREAKKNAGG